MIKDIELDGKIVKIEFVIPNEIKKFLQKNSIDENQLLKDYKWEQCIYEDLLDKNFKVKSNFEKAKLIINYIHITQNNQIRVAPENYAKGKSIGGGNWSAGTFFDNFSIGYSIFTE